MRDPRTAEGYLSMSDVRTSFHPLTIKAVERDTDEAVRLHLEVPGHLRDAFQFRPGQHMAIRCMIDGAEVRRTYSICSGPGVPGLTVTIKRVASGLFSEHANLRLRAGDTLDVMAPAGRFTLPLPGERPRTYLAIAAGSGITPIVSMIRHAMVEEPGCRFVLVYGNRRVANILFREELEDLKDRHLGRLSIAHVLSQGEETDVALLAGRIDAAKLEALLPPLVPIAEIDHAFLCGPDTLIKTSMQTLQKLGLPRERIQFEFFARGESRPVRVEPKPAKPAVEAGPELSVTLDGSRYTISMRPDETVLDAAIRAGANAPYSCRGGMCCTCRAKVTAGEAVMQQNFSLEPWEMAAGFILTCQAKPKSDRIAVNYDHV